MSLSEGVVGPCPYSCQFRDCSLVALIHRLIVVVAIAVSSNIVAMAHIASFFTSFRTSAPPKDPTVTLCRTNKLYKPELELAVFKVDNEVYTRYSSVYIKGRAKDKDRPKASPIWQFGEKVIRSSDGAKLYYCYRCECEQKQQQFITMDGTSAAAKHLTSFQGELADKEANPKSKGQFIFVSTERYDAFKRLIIRWIVYCHIAFKMLENRYFRELVYFLNSGIGGYLPAASATIRMWVKEEYEKQKKDLISNAKCC